VDEVLEVLPIPVLPRGDLHRLRLLTDVADFRFSVDAP
jgi:hypothetical protein